MATTAPAYRPTGSFQEPSCPDQLDVVLHVPFHGHNLPPWQDLPLLQPALSEGLQGGAAHHYQDELYGDQLQSF
jgi:hypothetical protein